VRGANLTHLEAAAYGEQTSVYRWIGSNPYSFPGEDGCFDCRYCVHCAM
jgi:cell wall-associated NlpC family hydrolase